MSTAFKYSGERKSYQSFNEVYFWTSVIKDWKHLLKDDVMKMIIIQSFQWLVQHELVYIYGYVPIAIGMPNPVYRQQAYTCFMGTAKNEWQRISERKL